MKKALLVVFILADLALMTAAAYVLYVQVTRQSGQPRIQPIKVEPAAPRPGVAASTTSVLGQLPTPPAENSSGSGRKILFSYPNAKAREVSIRGDFTGWKPETMKRNEKGVWVYQAALEPGEYGYAYTLVDDKGVARTVRDMANPRTKKIGTQFVSSIIVQAPIK